MAHVSRETDGEIYSAIPEVHFDIDFRHYLKEIDFDTLEYTTYLQEQGITDRDITRLQLYFTPREIDETDAEVKAKYIWPSNSQEKHVIQIGIDPLRRHLPGEQEYHTKALLHETKHLTDYIERPSKYRLHLIGGFLAHLSYWIDPSEIRARRTARKNYIRPLIFVYYSDVTEGSE